ncbi:glycosyl hydrolase catalytic core-domain-containing protein [Xylariales sp. PMI_506]|nr:glycosyl hydrolase catalytic core-domain-containing protein [Xylariales sp. PMI_506]
MTPSSKRTLLWDWTLTRDYQATPALHETVSSLQQGGLLTRATNWNVWRPPELPAFLHFRPTVRTPDQLAGSEWENLRHSLIAELQYQDHHRGGKKEGEEDNGNNDVDDEDWEEVLLFTFNEPERIPLSPAAAAQLWRDKLIPLRRELSASSGSGGKKLKLVSPACASDPAGTQWLDAFFEQLVSAEAAGAESSLSSSSSSLLPDYIGAHYYTDPAGTSATVDEDLTAVQTYLTDLQARHAARYGGGGGGGPAPRLVVSEIASTSRDAVAVERFSRAAAAWMDQQAWIREFAFFGAMREVADGFVSPDAQMLDGQGRWTKLGRWWAGLE